MEEEINKGHFVIDLRYLVQVEFGIHNYLLE
jgi:hypothetical protein